MLDRQWTALCQSRGKGLFSNNFAPNLWTAKSQRRHDIGSQLHVPDPGAGSMTEAPQILLNHRLKSLRLPTVLREYGKLAKQAAAEGLNHVQFLARLIELEMIDRDLPPGFGAWNSVFRRFRRWAEGDVFQRIFDAISGEPDFEYVLVDGTIINAHRPASGAKGGIEIRRSGAQRAG